MPSAFRKQRDEERKMQTRHALIEAAIRTFAKNGYHKTLISDIVAEAGVGQGTFYRNFSSKREIFELLFDEFATDLIGQFSEMSENLPRNLEEYRAASLKGIRQMAAALEENREAAMMFLGEATSIDKEFEGKVTGLFNRFAALAQFLLDHAIEQGFARPGNSEVVSQSLVGIAWRLINAWWQEEFSELSVEEISEEIVDFAFKGFGPID